MNYVRVIKQCINRINSKKQTDIVLTNKSVEAETQNGDAILQKVIELIDSGRNVFITGGAGTGKSYLLQQLKEHYKYDLNLTSTTGISAININGQTIHSWASVGICDKKIDKVVEYIKSEKVRYKKIVLCKILAIDEISMLKSDVFDYINKVLQMVMENSLPFGGIRVIVIGDFFQLPPVIKDRKIESKDFCFNSKTWKDLNFYPIVLKEVKRQTDKKFIDLLNNIRKGNLSIKDKALLWNRDEEVSKMIASAKLKDVLKLFSTNKEADNYNKLQLLNMEGEMKSFLSYDKFAWYAKGYPNALLEERVTEEDLESKEYKKFNEDCRIPDKLQIKKGCRVMLLYNLDVKNNLANGSCGTVTKITDNEIYVLFDNNNLEAVKKIDIEVKIPSNGKFVKNIYKDDNGDEIEEEVFAETKKIIREQFPLRLAYGITVHKSQGMTFDKLIVDCGKFFADGQGYVALSRTRSFDGLYPINFDPNRIVVNSDIIKFYEKLEKNNDKTELPIVEEDNSDNRIELINWAIAHNKKIKITHQKSSISTDAETTMRIIQPYKLAYGRDLECDKYSLYSDKLYLQGFCELRKEERTFLLDRILDIEII